MKKLPKLAVVGRPNVGKSALFNRICRSRIAIVDEAEGITRDRLYAESELFGRPFEVIDTGGIDPQSSAEFSELIRRQAEIAIEEADSIVMVVDAQTGITDLDQQVARILLRTKKPLTLAVNKIDHEDKLPLVHEFYALGIEKIVPVSAAQNWQIAELLETALNPIPVIEEENLDEGGIRVAIVGRPNVGKSSLINTMLDEQRCIVSPIPGTTRDSIDIAIRHGDDPYTFIDTAGIRRKGAEHEVVDKFAAIRTKRAIDRAEVCLLVLDSQEGLTAQEKRIAKMIEEEGKGCILLFNKWDLVKGVRMEHCLKGLEEEVPFLKHCPKVMISAKTGRNLEKIFPLIKECHAASQLRISTGQLNKFMERAIQRNHPPMLRGKRLRIYYMAQVDIQPPRFVMFVNHPDLMVDSYRRYIYNQFREVYPFPGVPLFFHLKGKTQKERPAAQIKPLYPHRQEQMASEEPEFEEELEEEFDDESFFDEE